MSAALDPSAAQGVLTARSQRRWAEVVEARLVELGRDRRDLAAALELTGTKLGRILNGTSVVSLGQAVRVLAELGLEVRPVGEHAVTIGGPRR